MAQVTKDLGIATAYGYALSRGYTGTEEEYAVLMASYGTVAEEAGQSAENAENSAEISEAWAVGTKDGTAVTEDDPEYNNNAKYYAEQAGTLAGNASDYAEDAEAWAVGERGGVPVGSTDETYHNNSKYYAQSISGAAAQISANTQAISDEVTNRQNADTALSNQIAALQSAVGSPLQAATVSGMTDHDKIYVYTGSETGYTAGNWYYWDGAAWVSGGVYNAVAVTTDTTLSIAGEPADAKVTGDNLTDLKSHLTNTDNELFDYEYLPQSITWETGSIYSSSGTNYDSITYRIRTSEKFSLPANTVGVRAADGYKLSIYAYETDSNTSYVGVWQGNAFQKTGYYIDGIVFFADLPSGYKYRFTLEKTDDGAITASDYTGCLIAVSKFLPVENDIANAYKAGGITPIMGDLAIKTKNVFDSFTINSGSFSFTVGVSNISNYTDYATASSVSKNTPPVRIRDFNGELIYKNLRLNLDKESKPTTCAWLFDKNGYYLRAVTHSQFYHRTDTVNYFKTDEYFAIFNLFPGVSGYEDYAWIVDSVNIEWLNAIPEYHVGADKEFTSFNGMLTALADDPREKIVYIDPGEYDIFEEYGGAEYMASLADTASSLNWRDVCKVVPPNTHLIGIGDVTLKWDATAEDMQNAAVTTLFSPLNISGNCIIENIKVIGRNCRYAVHDETSGLAKFDGSVHHYKNCYFECLQSTYGATSPYGSGHNKNMTLIFDDCEFVNYQNNAWATHHQSATATEKSTIIFNHCIFRRSTTGSDFYVQFTTDKTNDLKDEVRFNGCYIAAKIKFYTARSSAVQQGYDVTLVGSSQVEVVYSANVTTRYDVRQLNAAT